MTTTAYSQSDTQAQILDLQRERDALLDDLVRAERQLTAAREVRCEFAARLRRMADDLDAALHASNGEKQATTAILEVAEGLEYDLIGNCDACAALRVALGAKP